MAALEQSVAIAEAHAAVAQKVNEQVCKVLDEFIKAKENDKKKLQAEGNKLNAALNSKVCFVFCFVLHMVTYLFL